RGFEQLASIDSHLSPRAAGTTTEPILIRYQWATRGLQLESARRSRWHRKKRCPKFGALLPPCAARLGGACRLLNDVGRLPNASDRRAARGPPPSPPLRACEHLQRLRAPIGGPIVPGLAWFLITGACLQADVEVRHPRCRAALALEGQNAKVKKLPTRSSPIRWVARLRWSSRQPSPLA